MRNKHLHTRIRVQETSSTIDLGDFMEGHDLYIDVKPTDSQPGGYAAKFADCYITDSSGSRILSSEHPAIGNTPALAVEKLCNLVCGKMIIKNALLNSREDIYVPWNLTSNFTPAAENQVPDE